MDMWECIVPFMGTGIKAIKGSVSYTHLTLPVPFMGTGIKVLKYHIYGSRYQIVPFMGTGIKASRRQ